MSAPRFNYHALAPKAARAGTQFSQVAGSTLDRRLRELVNLRISQINGCAFCIDMHWTDLLKQGVEPRHVNAVAGWLEASRFFSDAECAALNWAEAVNAIPHRAPSDADFEAVRRHLSDAQIADLTFQVGAIRSWNMLNASFHTQVPETPYAVE
ncbi:carboxymuconolactone decarboxylase family protein [Variovorax sp. EBFNA2]|uniref:carboxymuconolactone decarboxylase family protein n=1 Tax=Variovorax sp. EBFNA2 TaxID=3342097 RepID=UPI0029BFBCE1|nr:carboxymuconolactone decarboxylase family protein [Variovorax boronicumulans]WPG41263.1 carboxymuconolactone decarboxylase family protein [Variovorax boronicumulans]